MKVSVRDLSFSYANGYAVGNTGGNAAGSADGNADGRVSRNLFNHFSADFDLGETGRPLVILGPSGCGKTTLLKLLGGLLKPNEGRIIFSAGAAEEDEEKSSDPKNQPPKSAFIFQEARLLPWLTVLENVSLPLEKDFGREDARRRARHFLSLVFLEEKENSFPRELSGGQAQRVSMARAFAWPAPALFMDEPFQSLDIPLRLSLMDLTMSLLEKENSSKENSSKEDFSKKVFSKKNRLLIAVTHDPREAVYMGGRIIILGKPGEGIVFDRTLSLSPEDRAYGSAKAEELEREMRLILKNEG